MAVPFHAALLYQLRDNTFWPPLVRAQPIPPTLQSGKATSNRPSCVGLGIVKAACAVLTDSLLDGLAVDHRASHGLHWTAYIQSRSSPGTIYTLGGDRTTWWMEQLGYLHAIAWLLDALIVMRQDQISTEFRQRWSTFLQWLEQDIGSPPPYAPHQLIAAAYSPPSAAAPHPASMGSMGGMRLSRCTEAMMAVSDALYFYAKERHAGPDFTCIKLQPDPAPLPPRQGAIAQWLYLQSPAPATTRRTRRAATPAAATTGTIAMPAIPPLVDTTSTRTTTINPASASDATKLLPTLRRVIGRGGTCLLIGPTGNGKSTAVRQAAAAEGVRIVKVDGWPTMTDRELFGKVNPIVGPHGEQRHAWVDGPLGTVCRAVQAGGRALLLIEELARFDPLYLAPLMALLDPLPGQEVALMLGKDHPAWVALQVDARYRVITLPTGEQLVAAAERLPVVATTNLGADYLQSSVEFDGALLRRFELILDVPRLDADTRRRLLSQVHGVPGPIADILVAAEEHSTHETGASGGLLRRELNLGTCVNWARAAIDLRQAGLAWPEALVDAAERTVIPYVCGRDSTGFVDRPAADSFTDWLRQVITAAALSAA